MFFSPELKEGREIFYDILHHICAINIVFILENLQFLTNLCPILMYKEHHDCNFMIRY
jgi:hypothetical protein